MKLVHFNLRSVLAICYLVIFASGCSQTMPPKEPPQPSVSAGDEVWLEYTLKLKDQKVVDSNVGKDPLKYTQGEKKIIPGLENAIEGMHKGETKQVVIPPEQGYGNINSKAFQAVPKKNIPEKYQVVGTQLEGTNAKGVVVRPRVHEIKDESIVLDFNHPLAGQELFFDIKIVDIIKAASKTEAAPSSTPAAEQ